MDLREFGFMHAFEFMNLREFRLEFRHKLRIFEFVIFMHMAPGYLNLDI